MDSQYHQRLERAIDRELKSLPALAAPPTLAAGVMARIARRNARPWHQRSWQAWPGPVRAISFVLLAALFGALCFGGWELWQLRGVAFSAGLVADCSAQLVAVWNAIIIVAATMFAIAGKLGPAFMIACATVAFFSYLACVGLGTLMVRFAYARIRVRRIL